jgi:hypothetical protein
MKKILLLFIIITFSFNTNLIAEEPKKCKKFDVFCKSKEGVKGFWKNTSEFQKKGLKESADQIKGSKKK